MAMDMAAELEHRGPDSSGDWVDPAAGIAIGHRRLAIVDLSPTGHQPMVSASGRLVLAYNGEIYNFRELRAELEGRGRRFRGGSDTEVLVEACDVWGIEEAVCRLVGMFAFVVWDRTARTLTLVRDRLGIKPLYWARQDKTVLFASQCRSFVAHPQWRAEIDRETMAVYLRYGYVPAPLCIYHGAAQLRPGYILRFGAEGAPRETCYWHPARVAAEASQARDSFAEEGSVERLEALLREAVRARMRADVPLGALLSGGIDSSTVVALMQAQSGRPVRTFSIGFREEQFDEASHARAVAAHLGTEHTELYVEPQHALKLVPRLSEHFDEPFADASQLPTLLVSELARRQVTVALSGDGGDELFAGYNRYAMARTLRRLFAVAPAQLRTMLGAGLSSLSPSVWDCIFRTVPMQHRPRLPGDKLHKLAAVLRLSHFEDVYPQLLSFWPQDLELVPGQAVGAALPGSEEVPRELGEEVERMQLVDLMTYLPGDILTKVDRASMAHSLEVRVPLLDHRVVEQAWALPLACKVRRRESKWILRRVLERHVPRRLFERPKMGFGVPLDAWLRGPLREWAGDLLEEGALRASGLYRVEPILERWREHLSGRRNWQYSLWTVLMAEAWRRRWLEGERRMVSSGDAPDPAAGRSSMH